MNIKSVMKETRQRWHVLLQCATWMLALFSSFVLPPPLWDYKEDSVWFRFSHFIVSVLIGLFFVPMRTWSAGRYKWHWWTLTVAVLLVGVMTFFKYQSLRAEWTRSYAGSRVVIGETYTGETQNYREKRLREDGRAITDEELIMDSIGRTETIWEPIEIRRRRLRLAAIYLGGLSLFAMAIVFLIQATHCTTRKDTRSGREASQSGRR